MKKFIDESKKKVIEKLKYISSIMDLVANILKSFATAIGSLVAAITAGVTGYYEVKKIVKKEHKKTSVEASNFSSSGEGSGASAITSTGANPQQGGYYFDANSGFFLLSIVFLGYMLIKKIKNKEAK